MPANSTHAVMSVPHTTISCMLPENVTVAATSATYHSSTNSCLFAFTVASSPWLASANSTTGSSMLCIKNNSDHTDVSCHPTRIVSAKSCTAYSRPDTGCLYGLHDCRLGCLSRLLVEYTCRRRTRRDAVQRHPRLANPRVRPQRGRLCRHDVVRRHELALALHPRAVQPGEIAVVRRHAAHPEEDALFVLPRDPAEVVCVRQPLAFRRHIDWAPQPWQPVAAQLQLQHRTRLAVLDEHRVDAVRRTHGMQPLVGQFALSDTHRVRVVCHEQYTQQVASARALRYRHHSRRVDPRQRRHVRAPVAVDGDGDVLVANARRAISRHGL